MRRWTLRLMPAGHAASLITVATLVIIMLLTLGGCNFFSSDPPPPSAQALAEQGAALLGQGKVDEALAVYDQAILTDPHLLAVRVGRASRLSEKRPARKSHRRMQSVFFN